MRGCHTYLDEGNLKKVFRTCENCTKYIQEIIEDGVHYPLPPSMAKEICMQLNSIDKVTKDDL